MRPRRHLGGRGLGGRGIGQRSTSAGFSPTTALLAAPATPTLTLTTGATDNTPGFQFDGAIVELDNVRFQYSTDITFATYSEITNAIDAAEDAANQLIFSTGSLADNTWYFRARIERPLHFPSLWSNTEAETINTTAPTLSSPTGASTGQTTASLSVSTNVGNGTIYWVVDTNTSTPSKAQVKAGQDQGGGAADDSGSQAVSGTGSQPISGGADGLTAATTYKVFFMHEDGVGNQSNVSASSSFTTDASSITFDLSFTAHGENVTDGTSMTFSTLAAGAADSNRVLAAATAWRPTNSTDTISSVTIGGVSATQAASADSGNNANLARSDIWYAAVPTGTTATVVVNFSGGNALRATCALYRIITGTAAPTNAGATNGAGSGLSRAVTVPSGGAGIAIYLNRNDSDGAANWTNATEDYEAVIESASTGSAAHFSASATISVTSAGATGDAISWASWGV